MNRTKTKVSKNLEKREQPTKIVKIRDEALANSTNKSLVIPNTAFPRFKQEWFDLPDSDFERIAQTRMKLKHMTWEQVYATSSKGTGKRGINYEPVDQWTAQGQRIATIRVTLKYRARVVRNGAVMLFLSIHLDHDSAYRERGGEESEPLPIDENLL